MSGHDEIRLFKRSIVAWTLRLAALLLLVAAAIGRREVTLGLAFGLCIGLVNFDLMTRFNAALLRSGERGSRVAVVGTLIRLAVLAAGALGVSVTRFTKPKPEAELKGLVAGTQKDAMRQFKGGKPNLQPGAKVRLQIKVDKSLAETNVVVVSQLALDKMAAEPGDLLYASHIRWWYGGLRSVHVKAGRSAGSETSKLMLISPDDAATAHFAEDQQVVVEKII